jgi:hypothetical protein
MSKVTWKYQQDNGDTVVFEFERYGVSTDEMFQKWVEFMNAIGYVLDPVEMEQMWMGDRDG